MKIFIFGAGASKASQEGQSVEVSAPTVDQLFDEKYSKFANSVGLEPSELASYKADFKKTKSQSLELWLTDLWERRSKITSSIGKMQNRATFGRVTFYIWWLMQNVSGTYTGQNGYKLFLQKLGRETEEHGFINFNYDSLLDRALVHSGLNLTDTLGSYKRANYIKPHGSVNWFLHKRDDDDSIAPGEQIFDSKSRFRIATNTMYRDDPIPFKAIVFEPSHDDLNRVDLISSGKFSHQYAFPFMLVPLTTKLYGHFEKYQENILSPAKEMANKATEIYMIGYRASDEVIKDIFENVKDGTILHVVGQEGAKAIQDSVMGWKPGLKRGKIYSKGFSAFIESY